MRITFEVDPCPASRPRVTRWSTYYPKRYTKFKKDMQALTSEMETTLSKNLLSVHVDFYIKMPKSWSKKKTEKLANTYCSNNSDIDNYIKAILDALNGVLFIDDRQVVEIFARKIYSKQAYIFYKQEEIYGNDEVRVM
jgi:Holliday junction resolvase RusA-like endonuclease